MVVSGSVSIDSWLNDAKSQMPRSNIARRDFTFSSLAEKGEATSSAMPKAEKNGGRNLRTLPFSRETFELLSKNFYTNDSIARVVSRADVPIFSSESVTMSQQAYSEYPLLL
jgi:hypothetical protein